MKQNHYQELKQSAIADEVIKLNFRSTDGYNGFTNFVSLCNQPDKREGRQVCDTHTNYRYSHLYQGYWYANSWCPLTDTVDFKQIKPDYPMLRLVTIQGQGKYQQPVSLQHHPDKRYLPLERGYLWGTRQTIISIAKALNIADKLPMDESGNWHLEAISAMSPAEKYQWCYQNGAFDVFAFAPIKYETPTGNGTPFIYLNIPLSVLEEIATEYDLTLPEGYENWTVGDKWRWIRNHPEIPIFITEGIKKAASLISHGKIAIASFSITTHSEKADEGKSSWVTNLKPELLWLLEKNSGRLIYLVFDVADVKESSRQAVKRETKKIAKKLKKYGIVKIITWEDDSCKGIDDFIVKHGIQGLTKIIEDAVSFHKLWQKEIANYGRQLTPNLIINQRYLSANLFTQARQKRVKLLCVKSQQNTAKSYSYADFLKQHRQQSKTKHLHSSHQGDFQLENPNLNSHIINNLNNNNNHQFSSNYNNHQSLNINNPNQPSLNKSPSPSAKSHLYSLGDRVKIQVNFEVYDSVILGYNFATNKYQCQFKNSFIERDLTQIITNNNCDKLPEDLLTYTLTHRQSLAWNLADKFEVDCYLSNAIRFQNHGIVACADSCLMIPESQKFTNMVIDEAEQVSWHLLASNTEIRENRIQKIMRISNQGKLVVANDGMISILDADLSDIGVKFYQFLFGISDEDTLVVENTYKPFEGIRNCYLYDKVESLRHDIISVISNNQRIIIHTSGQKESSTHGTINIEKEILAIFPELESKIYRLDKESLGDSTHLSHQILSDLDKLKQAQIVIASSCINTGVSLDEEVVGTFDAVYGIFYGNYPLTDFEQAIERYRGNCHRYIHIKNASSERINLGSYKYSDLLNNIIGQSHNIQNLLKDDFHCDLAMDLVKFYCKFATRINNDYIHLKSNFISHLEDKGYTILNGNQIEKDEAKALKEMYQFIRDESENNFQEQVFKQEIPSPQRLAELEKSKTKTKGENIEEYKGQLAKKYRTNNITRELIGLDREGFFPQLLLKFWLSMDLDLVIKRDKRVLTKYSENNDYQGYAIDFNRQSISTQIFLLNHIGLNDIINKFLNLQSEEILMLLLSMQVNPIWFKCVDMNKLAGLITESDVIPYLSIFDSPIINTTFKQVFNIDLEKNHTPIQLLRMILKRIGYKIEGAGRLGARNNRKRYYRITNCISDELMTEIFDNWLRHELMENALFENDNQQVA